MTMPETDTGAAFAAGHATATAEQAAEQAATAEVRADIAQDSAEDAQDRAAAAESVAFDARAAVDGLRDEVMGALADIRESLSTRAGGDGTGRKDDTAGTAAPAPERKEDAPAAGPAEPAADTPSKPRRAYGSRTWFGD